MTAPDIFAAARALERRQIEGSHDALFVAGGPMLARWKELGAGAQPAQWAIDQARHEASPAYATQAKAALRADECSLAEISAARPRKPFQYFYYGLGAELIRAIEAERNRADICWQIIRGICRYRRLTGMQAANDQGISRRNSAILIRAELRRMAAARATQALHPRELQPAL